MKVDSLKLEPQPECDLVKLPADFDHDTMLEQASRHASNYSVIFVRDGQVFGSGTLVKVEEGVHGILTAHHVALVAENKNDREFSLCIHGKVIHRLDVNTSQYHHLIVGDSRRHFDHSGPDLSLLMLTDRKLFATLDSVKSFYPLRKQCDVGLYPVEKLRHIPWVISGSPAEFSEELGMYRGERLTKHCDFHIPVHFRSLRQKAGFDYFRFEVHSGVHGYPKAYGGVSGGGVWMATIEQMTNGDIDFPPILQGVVFYESRPYEQHTRRLLIGHGPESIYARLSAALL